VPAGFAFWQVLAVEDRTAYALAVEDGGPNQSVVAVDLASGEVQDEATTPVGQPDDPDAAPVQAADLGYVYADERAYGVDFDRAGEAGVSWMAFTVG
jgi:hypothetical protein